MDDDKYTALAQHLGAAVAAAVVGEQKGKAMARPSQEYAALTRQIEAAGWDVDECERIFDHWVEYGYKSASDLIVRYKAAHTRPSPRSALEALLTGQPLPATKARRPDAFAAKFGADQEGSTR